MRKWDQKYQQSVKTKIDELVFEGEKPADAICGICKLSFPGEQPILQCSQCNSFFHQKPLHDWLQKNKNCPVCQEKLV